MTGKGWSPGPKYQLYLKHIKDILTDERRTVRSVYYALEARGFPDQLQRQWFSRYGDDPPDDQPAMWEFDYNYVKRAVKKGRRHGFIDPELIVDTSRPTVTEMRGSHPEPAQFMRNNEEHIKHGYFENFWEDQPKYVEVWLEKASMSSVFEAICDDYNVHLEATRGDWSDSKVYEACQRLISWLNVGKDVKILYFGDFNPSGLHAPVSVQETMGHYGLPLPIRDPDESVDGDVEERLYFDIWPFDGPFEWENTPGSLEFERVAINLEHVKRFDLPENPTPSGTDKDRKIKERFMDCASDGRDVNIELDALKEFQREFLEDALEAAIAKHIDADLREETEARRDRRQAVLREAMGEVDYEVLEDV